MLSFKIVFSTFAKSGSRLFVAATPATPAMAQLELKQLLVFVLLVTVIGNAWMLKLMFKERGR